MERTGRSTATAYEPLPAHLHAAAAQDPPPSNGMTTPTYGGLVSPGMEWDWVVNPDGSKSRTASRSPHRTLPDTHRSLSNPLDAGTPGDAFTHNASASAHAFSAHPSTQPHEPTISEEANAYIGKSVAERRPPAASPGSLASQTMPSPNMPSRQMGSGRAPASPRNHTDRERETSARDPAAAASAALAPPHERFSTHSTSNASSSKRRQYRQVGDWILQKTLGAGSMGKVKLGVNVHTQERCAVKIVPRHRDDPSKTDSQGRSKDESKEIRTVREASISLLLHHPYICGMRDFLVHQNHYYMVFEYIDGGQMLDYIIAHGRLRERAARKFARQIGSALDYCHHNNIVHRDLKIENILISNNGNIKIIDFGLSNLFSPHRHLSTFCGSLYFAAPELLNAKLYTGPEVDIWSFGIVLYVLVCGKVPFDDQSMPALHAKIKRGLAEYPAWLSNDCKSLLQRMLNTNPHERATLSEVLSHPWMTKGFEGRPDSHLIHREPLRAEDLDMDVINRMQGFTFGTPEEIYDNLSRILTSEAYIRCVQQWEARRDRGSVSANGSMGTALAANDFDSPKKKRFSGFDLKKKLFKEEKKIEEPVPTAKQPLDPSSGFDPLISIYFLAKEKKERSKVYGDGHFASSRLSMNGAQPGYSAPVASIAAPPTAHGAGFEQGIAGSPRDPASSSQPQSRLRAEEQAAGVMQHPAADAAKSNIADVPSAHHRRGVSQAQPPPVTHTSAHAPVSSATVPLEETRTSTDRADRRVSVGSMSNAMGRTSLSRDTSQRTSNTAAQPVTPPDWPVDLGYVQDKSGGIRPVGAPEVDEIEAADVANIDVKSVYLKGLFSVSTTSTKSARTLLKDISHCLDRIGIKYRPIRGGFECIHVPSIDLTSVVHGDEARSSLHVPVSSSINQAAQLQAAAIAAGAGGSMESSPSKNKLALRNAAAAGSSGTSRGDSPSPAGAIHASSSGTVAVLEGQKPVRLDLDDGDAWGQQFGANSTLCVRFEVYVVKVPWLPLHGIQFRRIGGDGWQYQQLAKTILREMRL